MVQAGDPGVSHPGVIPCVAGSDQDLAAVRAGTVSAAAGRAAHDFLTTAIRLVQAGGADAIVTAPLHKEALRAAGLPYPGHTEILAEQTGTRRFGMMLYARTPELSHGLGVIHVTLHLALRDVFARLSTEAVLEKIALLDGVLRRLKQAPPRIGVAGLNPHASDGGLFGSEETALIEPAVRAAQAQGMNASGPWPGDVLFVRARRGEFDGIVAMYHDQGHIPMKLLAGFRAVNISVGLPLIRTSVAHGTAYDIAGKGLADPHSLIEAARVAAQLAQSPNGAPCHTARPVTS
jgi:4-hydroxythreonine-4-phosphate dehydrogenase